MRPRMAHKERDANSSSSNIDDGNENINMHSTTLSENQSYPIFPSMQSHETGSPLDLNLYPGNIPQQPQPSHSSNQYNSRSSYQYNSLGRPPPSQNQQHFIPPNTYHADPLSSATFPAHYSQDVTGADMRSYSSMTGISGELHLSNPSVLSPISDLPPASVSATDAVHDVTPDPYYNPYLSPGNTQIGTQFYPTSTGPAYGQGQYQSMPYGVQYYPSYGQAPFYNPQRPPPGWIGAPSPQHQGWRPPPYYNYSGGNSTVSASFHRTSNLNKPRQQAGQGVQIGPRSASTSSRTSPNSNTPTRSGVPSGVPIAESSRSGLNRIGRAAAQPLQGQGPRTEHVLWCGNVPADATVDELYAFFSRLPIETIAEERNGKDLHGTPVSSIETEDSSVPAHGVLSIFIITRSSCAFINYATARHLERALVFFQGQSLRPEDPRCPKLVCRVRKKDDEAQAGVAGQRGRGIHVAWLKEQEKKAKEETSTGQGNDEAAQSLVAPQAVKRQVGVNLEQEGLDQEALRTPSALTPTPQRANPSYLSQPRPSIDSSSVGSGSASLASTNSSLFRHPAFRERFFILKSLRVEDLDQSVKNGTWATQVHNEAVLDQAFRNSESVYLIFSANQSGSFYGYARMAGPINSTAAADRNATIRPDSIPEGDEGSTIFQPRLDLPPQTLTDATGAFLSPLQMTPSSEGQDDAMSIQNINSVSLDVPQKSAEKREPQRSTISSTLPVKYSSGRSDTVSPTNLIAIPGAAPPVTAIAPEPSPNKVTETFEPTSQVPETTAAVLISPSTEKERELFTSELDPDRTSQRERRAVPSRQTLSLGSTTSEPIHDSFMAPDHSGENSSIGPNESASYPTDARTQSQLAIKALIHNLRLDEKESIHRAKQLEAIEAGLKAKDQSTLDATETEIEPQPLASSPETWGKSFKVEWIKVYPISFSSVRRLRNPWRDNRQVKVSRDGTELEPNVGRQLLEEWSKAEKDFPAGIIHLSLNKTDDEEEEDE